MISMIPADYLVQRGWIPADVDDDGVPNAWVDPRRPSAVPADGGGNLKITWDTDEAVQVQKARDAEDDRRAWVAFAAARLAINAFYTAAAAEEADAMLAAYVERFGVRVCGFDP